MGGGVDIQADVAIGGDELQTVEDGVFYQRLYGEGGKLAVQNSWGIREIYLKLKLAGKAKLLYEHVVAHVFDLICQGTQGTGLLNAAAEQVRDGFSDSCDLRHAIFLRVPSNGFQGVEQKMGVDLALQRIELCLCPEVLEGELLIGKGLLIVDDSIQHGVQGDLRGKSRGITVDAAIESEQPRLQVGDRPDDLKEEKQNEEDRQPNG